MQAQWSKRVNWPFASKRQTVPVSLTRLLRWSRSQRSWNPDLRVKQNILQTDLYRIRCWEQALPICWQEIWRRRFLCWWLISHVRWNWLCQSLFFRRFAKPATIMWLSKVEDISKLWQKPIPLYLIRQVPLRRLSRLWNRWLLLTVWAKTNSFVLQPAWKNISLILWPKPLYRQPLTDIWCMRSCIQRLNTLLPTVFLPRSTTRKLLSAVIISYLKMRNVPCRMVWWRNLINCLQNAHICLWPLITNWLQLSALKTHCVKRRLLLSGNWKKPASARLLWWPVTVTVQRRPLQQESVLMNIIQRFFPKTKRPLLKRRRKPVVRLLWSVMVLMIHRHYLQRTSVLLSATVLRLPVR